MDTEDIVPAILAQVPPSTLSVTYPTGKQVNFGAELSPNETKEAPSVRWECDPGKYHTLLMFDPDAPSRRYPVLGQVNHWLVGNIQDSDLSTGDVIAEYIGPGPPIYSGLHRYFFVLLEQKGVVEFEERRIAKSSKVPRLRFSTGSFLEKYQLEVVLAWNGFRARWRGGDGRESRTCVCL